MIFYSMLVTQRPVQHTDNWVQSLRDFPSTCAPQGFSVTVPGLTALALLSPALLFALALLRLPPMTRLFAFDPVSPWLELLWQPPFQHASRVHFGAPRRP
jgi:hypothetical protein